MRVIVLDYIAVHPSHQKKGVGLALLQNGVAKARSLGLDVFVLACEGGFKLYEKAGFKELDRIVQDATRIGGTSDYEVRFMVHEMAGS
jgi:predicted N-acetyltransferase YhbS